MAVETELGLGLEGVAHRRQARLDRVGQQVAGRVGDVDAVGAIAFHQPGLLHQAFGAVHVRHHQKTDGVHAQLARVADVLLGDVGFGAVGGDANRRHPQLMRHLQVLDGADARQQQRRDLGLLHERDHRAEVFLVAVGREAVVHRAATEAVAVGDLDQRHARFVQTDGDGAHLLERHQVALGVHAVTQRHVVDGDFLAAKFHVHLLLMGAVQATIVARLDSSLRRPARISSANISAVRAAAAVMMSRLPAYLGR